MGGAYSELDSGVAELEDAGALESGADAAPPSPNSLGCLPGDLANCDALVAALAHRYSFDGTGSSVVDAVGGADGSVVDGTLSGSGALVLTGDDDYVDLPNGLISALTSATFEAWVNWDGGAQWQRIFDFGRSDADEDERGVGEQFIFLTPRSSTDTLRVSFLSPDLGAVIALNAAVMLPAGVETHVAVVVDGVANTLALVLDGEIVNRVALPSQLAAIDDVNNWLGLAQFAADPSFEGSLLELRIYQAALTDEQLALSFTLGSDAPVSP
jgi:arabinan endo-1,5-alpha-L-arabinosidase